RGLDDVRETEQQKSNERPFPSNRVEKERDQHPHHLVQHDVPRIGFPEITLRDAPAPRSESEEQDNNSHAAHGGLRKKPPQQEADDRAGRTGSHGRVTGAERRSNRERQDRSG